MAALLASGLTKFIGSVAAATKEWGQGQIHWVSLDQGKQRAMKGKPLMVVVHRNRCPACVYLGKRFSESRELQELAQGFVMVHTMASVDETGFLPDGGYVPRVLFFDPQGNPLPQVKANARGGQIYAYSSDTAVLKNMKIKMAEYFVMVETDESGAPSRAGFRPDSGYLPSILFFDPQGRPLADVTAGEGRHLYAYGDEGAVLRAMHQAATMVQK